MSGELTVFETALAQLKAQMPDTFDLEVEDHVFRNVGSFAQAARITRTMEGMKSEAAAMGYAVKTTHVNGTPEAPWYRVWRYSFVKTSMAKEKNEGAIEV